MSDPTPFFHPRGTARFRAKEGTLAIHGSAIGQVLDVSRSGISFQYVALDERPAPNSPLRIVFKHDHDYFRYNLTEFPNREVYDRPLHEGLQFSFLNNRRRGLSFLEMSAAQIAAMEYLITHHTLYQI